jgi:hypothetical protein
MMIVPVRIPVIRLQVKRFVHRVGQEMIVQNIRYPRDVQHRVKTEDSVEQINRNVAVQKVILVRIVNISQLVHRELHV